MTTKNERDLPMTAETECIANAAGHCPHADDGGLCHYCDKDVRIDRAVKHLLRDLCLDGHVWSKTSPLSHTYSCELCDVVWVSSTGTRPTPACPDHGTADVRHESHSQMPYCAICQKDVAPK